MAENTELAFDLRQKYAEIVGVHLEAVSMARISKDFPDYFRSLDNLFTVVKHKFKKKKTAEEEDNIPEEEKAKKKDKEEKKTPLERYNILRGEAIKMANEYPNAFLKRTETPSEVSKVESSLRAMEEFLFKVMDDAKMFGSVGYNEGI